MNKFFIITGICCLSLVLWLTYSFVFCNKNKEPYYVLLSDKITHKYLKEYAKPKGLEMCGFGGAMMYDIKELNMHFTCTKSLDVNQARILYIEAVEEFLIRINENEEIRPFLHDYPFTFKNVRLMISFEEPKGRQRISDGHLALMFCVKGKVIYQAYDPEKNDFYCLYEEPYEEVLEIIKNETQKTHFKTKIRRTLNKKFYTEFL